MSARIFLKVSQTRLDIYEAQAIADLMGNPRLSNDQFLFCIEAWDIEDQLDLDNKMEAIRSDLTDYFGPLIADVLMDEMDVRHSEFDPEVARFAAWAHDADQARDLYLAEAL